MMIGNKVLSGGTVMVDYQKGEFTFEVSRGKRSGTASSLGRQPARTK